MHQKSPGGLTRNRLLSATIAVLVILAVLVPQGCAPAPAAPAQPTAGAAPSQPTAAAPSQATYKWRLAQVHPVGSDYDLKAVAMADTVRKKTNGRIDIQVYSGGTLGDWTEAYEQVMRGTLEMNLDPPNNVYDPRLTVAYYWPYLFKNLDEAKKAWRKGGYMYTLVSELLEQQGVKGLAVFPLGMAGATFNAVPPSPGDPDVPKNMKVRVMPQKACELTYKRLGYLPTAIPWAETFTALQTKVADGQMGGPPYQGFLVKDVQKAWVQYNDYQETYWFMINLKLWNQLSKEDQQILQDACEEQAALRWDIIAKEDEDFRQQMKAAGLEIIILSEAELEKCAAAVRKDVWPQLESMVGKTITDRLYADLGISR